MKFHQEFIGQLELGETRAQEKDRNYHLGGRSFYFFDFDDNIAFLATPLVLFHRHEGSELLVNSGEWAQIHHQIGASGLYEHYEIRFDDSIGTFRYFRDHGAEDLMKLGLQTQIFVKDVLEALDLPDLQWKGPSWDCFYHATFNRRPISLITARGHQPSTFREGIKMFVAKGHLPQEPNYLSIFPVSHVPTRISLGDAEFKMGTAQLKQSAIRASVEQAFQTYGYSPHHRFGMSDDDPKNIQSIYEELRRLKHQYPEISFFLIETHQNDYIKHEVRLSGTTSELVEHDSARQLPLF